MASVAERLAAARRRLEASGISAPDAAIDAEVLARHTLGWDRADLIVRGHDPEPPDFRARFEALIGRREMREPVAHIIGSREFWELDFEVTPDVLIPRPETEIIVDEALTFAAAHPCRTVVDVGTGSGCLAVSIAHALPGARVTAIDISPAALGVAVRNATRHGVADQITFERGDLLEAFTGRVDLIVSNPPYVPDADLQSIQEDVARYEPHSALFGGPSGLEVVGRLFRQAHDHLAAGGHLIVEFGFGQSERVSALAAEAGWRVVRIREDLQSIPRTIVLASSMAQG